MRLLFALVAALALAGCGHTQPPAPQVKVSGPEFTPDQFDCGQRPIPPNLRKDPARAASATALHVSRLGTWGQRCANKLGSVGETLRGAGQVVDGE